MRLTFKSRLTTRRRKVAAWLGILALTLPILVPFAQGISLPGALDNAQRPSYLIICKTMQQGSSPTQDQAPKGTKCPICLGLALGKSVLLTPQLEAPACEIYPLAFIFNTNNEKGNGRLPSRARARAPPISA